jgi:hypothetical protein
VRAFDSKGLTASNRLDVTVQQHKQIRAMNHEFHIYLKIEKRSEFKTNVDWELKVGYIYFKMSNYSIITCIIKSLCQKYKRHFSNNFNAKYVHYTFNELISIRLKKFTWNNILGMKSLSLGKRTRALQINI